MKLDEKKILARANEIYAEEKLREVGRDVAYVAPECRPQIASWQVMGLLRALVEELNGNA